jgi:hypothetical protein
MSTSNKLILAFIIFVFGSFLAIHVVLHHKYVKGDFVAQQELWQENFVNHPLSKPRVIVLEGTIWVNLIPADSFVLAMPRINKDPDAGMFKIEMLPKSKIARTADEAITWLQRGDTLYITGTVQIPIHRPYSEWFYRRELPVVDIYSSSFDNILLNHGQVCLRGVRSGGSQPAHLTVLNSTLWIGMQYSNPQRDPQESFDELNITSSNSSIVVNSPARVKLFNAQLKDSSQLIDNFSAIDSSIVRSSADSRINLTGENFKRSQITVQQKPN